MKHREQPYPICPSCRQPIISEHGPECRVDEEVVACVELENNTELGRWTNEIVADALDEIRAVFDFNFHEENFTYHGLAHTQGVIRRTRNILDVLGQSGIEVTQKTIALAQIAAAYHDTKQEWFTKTQWDAGSDDETYGRKFRQRKTKTYDAEPNQERPEEEINEFVSAEHAIRQMQRANEQSGQELFSEEDMETVKAAIVGTIPKFEPKLGTVVQVEAEASDNIVVCALALADIGEAGMTGPEAFLQGGDALFVEENIDVWHLNPTKLSDDQKAYYKTRMMGWNESQAGFARGRKQKLDDELATFPEAAQVKLKELFNAFDATIQAADERSKKRNQLSFEELYEEMGFVPQTSEKGDE